MPGRRHPLQPRLCQAVPTVRRHPRVVVVARRPCRTTTQGAERATCSPAGDALSDVRVPSRGRATPLDCVAEPSSALDERHRRAGRRVLPAQRPAAALACLADLLPAQAGGSRRVTDDRHLAPPVPGWWEVGPAGSRLIGLGKRRQGARVGEACIGLRNFGGGLCGKLT